jgi:CrcB protein
VEKLLFVGLGGFAGSVLRYVLGGYVQNMTHSVAFPFGTLAVNVAGCLAIGFISQLSDSRAVLTPEGRLLIVVGLLGGFTTFSAFGNETLYLAQDGQMTASLLNVAANLVAGLAAVWLGRSLAFWLWG